ncbi:MAG: threonylcarbamoyl-AMP synthase [Paludibacteraceae bacterium]|nr:threonylcarbamoyl-AMP synthase [Paludibacteraceae bacterium]
MDEKVLSEVKKCVEVLRAGGVILYPTDTIWGVGCDATNSEAVKRIFEIKQRADSKSMIALVDTYARMEAYVEDVPDMAWDLIEVAEKPLTIIYPKGRNLAPAMLAEDGSVGIRITEETFSKALCAAFRRPIVSTSANFSGCPAPAFFREIDTKLCNMVDYVVDFRRGDTVKKQPSSIIKLEKNGTFVLIRE